jgi:DtxR family Mn-dependent transcriptional regulator
MAGLSPSAQDYLKIIYKLQRSPDGDQPVTTSQIADRAGVAAASATNMVKRLAEMKLVRHTPYRGVELTPAGEMIALEVIRHHRLLELYLADALGYRWDEVDAEAETLEHVISEEFEDRIDEVLGYPKTDPHGAPIPSKDGCIERPAYERLSHVDAGTTVCVRQVSDRSPEMLRYLDGLGVRPDAVVHVAGRAPFNGPLQIRVQEGGECSIGLEAAAYVYVSAPDLHLNPNGKAVSPPRGSF